MITKEAKAEKVTALHAKFLHAKAAILADYSGLNVQQMAELRAQLRTASVELHVVKNTLARRALEDTTLLPLSAYIVGPTSMALTLSDPTAMAKTLAEYAKKEPKLSVRAGFVEGQVLSPAQITALAELPPREILLARLLASMQSPLVGLVGVLQGVLRQFMYTLLAIQEAKSAQEATAQEATAQEATAQEATAQEATAQEANSAADAEQQ